MPLSGAPQIQTFGSYAPTTGGADPASVNQAVSRQLYRPTGGVVGVNGPGAGAAGGAGIPAPPGQYGGINPGGNSPYGQNQSTPQQPTGGLPTQNLNSFTPGNYGQSQRQVVNDQGWFGGQAGNVNARLNQLLDPSYATVRRTDADVSPLFQQIDRRSVQDARLMQQQAAERAAAEGTLEGGGFSNMAQQINEQARASAGDQQAELMYNASNRRQQQIDNALGIASNLAEGQQGRNLQRELADLQNQQFNQDFGLRRDLGFGDLNLRGELGRGDLDLRRELGRGQLEQGNRQINNQNNQFYDDLGFRRSSFEGQMNQNIINQLLGF